MNLSKRININRTYLYLENTTISLPNLSMKFTDTFNY